jgi:hypothetical protein
MAFSGFADGVADGLGACASGVSYGGLPLFVLQMLMWRSWLLEPCRHVVHAAGGFGDLFILRRRPRSQLCVARSVLSTVGFAWRTSSGCDHLGSCGTAALCATQAAAQTAAAVTSSCRLWRVLGLPTCAFASCLAGYCCTAVCCTCAAGCVLFAVAALRVLCSTLWPVQCSSACECHSCPRWLCWLQLGCSQLGYIASF